jgi:pSer/pThr/pTyr-binding forkhead associated (FHA) protein
MTPSPPLHQSTPQELKARLEAERRGAPFLVLRDGDSRQRIVPLDGRSRLTVGRQPESDVALTWDEEVSRAHADIECIGNVWTLVDDGRSRNGSFVNGERVHGRRALHHNDSVAIGRTALTYIEPLADEASSTAPARRHTPPPVTAAQRRVLVALVAPYARDSFATPPSNREVAAELSVSVDTVKFHLHTLFETFGLAEVPQHQKRAALARLVLESGVVTLAEVSQHPVG